MLENLSLCCEDEFGNGAETVEIVFGIVFAVGLAACLIAFQGVIVGVFGQVQTQLKASFNNLLDPTK